MFVPLTIESALEAFKRFAPNGMGYLLDFYVFLRKEGMEDDLGTRKRVVDRLLARGDLEEVVIKDGSPAPAFVQLVSLMPGFIQLGPPITSAVAMAWTPPQDLNPVKFLGVTRKDNHNDWGWPGGGLEPNETPAECALRELREETGCIGEIIRVDMVTAEQLYAGRWGEFNRLAIDTLFRSV